MEEKRKKKLFCLGQCGSQQPHGGGGGWGVEKKESQKIRKTDLGPDLHQEREERVGQGGKVALFSLKLRNTGRPSQTL